MKMHYKVGATKDGKLMAIKADIVGDTGAYASSGEFVLFRACAFGGGPYEYPNAWMDSYAVYTNNVPAASMRGFGSTQPSVASECVMDRLAEACGIDPFEIRKINGLALGKQTVTGHVIDYGAGFQQALDVIRDAVQKDCIPSPSGPNKKIGIGVAGSMKNVGLGSGCEDSAWAQIRLGPDGKLIVIMGAVEFGQGCDTVMAQIAAQTLGVSIRNIEIAVIDSNYTLDGGITTASRQTFVSGNAVKTVSGIFKGTLLAYVSGLSGVPAEFLDCDKDGVYDIRNGAGYRISFEKLAKVVYDHGDDIYEKYYYVAPQTSPMKECSDNPSYAVEKYRLHFSYCFGVQAVVIEVDEETGEVKVLRVYAANDAGRAINPALVEGQIEGGVAMGIGYALSEKFLMQDGYVLTKQLKDMGIPRTTDVPTDIRPFIIEENHPYGPFGAKGMGEIPLNATAPGILNAIYDAVGVRVTSTPITPDRLLKLMREKNDREGGAE
jgi:CO/xanthine dehydrogenase Mo-binding subunit